jgi:hypothetical protein
MSKLKLQWEREDKHKPSVVNVGGIWWAQVIDMSECPHSELAWSQPAALAKAYDLAAMVERQRAELEPTA